MLSCIEVTEKYIESLSGGFECEQVDDRLRIVTPYPYPDNDLIEVFVEELGSDRARVTDLGETLRLLYDQGLDVAIARKRKEMVETIAAGRGVDVVHGQLVKEGAVSEIGEVMFDVIVAARGVSDLILTARTYEPATFREEVASFLGSQQIAYKTEAKLTGQSGKVYRVDFWLPESRKYMHTLSPRQVGGLQAVVNRVFRIWVDANGDLGRDAKFSLLNDIDFAWKEPEVALLQNVSIVEFWTRKEELPDRLGSERA